MAPLDFRRRSTVFDEPPFGRLPARHWFSGGAIAFTFFVGDFIARGVPSWVALSVSLGVLAILMAMVIGHNLRLKRLLRAADGLVCPECGYDLRASPEEGTCPECGIRYEHAAVRKRWRWHHGYW